MRGTLATVMCFHGVAVLSSPVSSLSSLSAINVNSSSPYLPPPLNIECDKDFGGAGAVPRYSDCFQAVAGIPRGTFA